MCNGISLARRKSGRIVLTAAKVFREIWRSFRDIYIDLCTRTNEYHVCRDHGPLLVRSSMLRIAGTSTPVGSVLRSLIFGRRVDSEIACRDILESLR